MPEYGEPREGPTDLSSDYTIDISEWFRYAKMHYSAVLGPMVGFTLLYLLLAVVLAFIPCGGLIQFFIDPPLQAGFTLVCLHQLRGKSWTFGDFFGGFQWYGSLLGNHLLTGLAGAAILLPGIVFVVVASNSRSEGLVAVAVVFAVANALVAVYVALRLALFSTPLIVDRGFGAVEALQGSWALTQGHFLGLFGVVLLLGFINLAGALLCFVGLLFTMPFTSLAMTAGYLLIANSERPVEVHDFQAGRPV